MRGLLAVTALVALAGLAAFRGYVDAWPGPRAAALLLVLPFAFVAILHVRAARQRRLRRYGLGW